MRFGCIGVIIAAALCWGGGQQIYESVNSGRRIDIRFADLVKEKPGVGWYRVTDAEWRLIDGGVITKGSGDRASGDIYAPVLPKGQRLEAQKIQVLLHRNDPEDAAKLSSLVAQPDEVAAMAMIVTNPALEKSRPVEGMIEFGINTDDKDNDAVKKAFGEQLDDNYLIITDGARPAGYLWPALMLLAGLALFAFMFAGFVGNKDAEPAAPADA